LKHWHPSLEINLGSKKFWVTECIGISLDPPKSLKLFQSVDVSNECYSVYKYEGNTYVGLGDGGGIDRIDESFSVSKYFVSLTNWVTGVTVYKNKLYALQCISSTNWVVHVYDLTGKQLTSRSHHDDYSSFIGLLGTQQAF